MWPLNIILGIFDLLLVFPLEGISNLEGEPPWHQALAMPAKGKKKGKGKGKKKKLKGMGETAGDIVKRLYRIYLNNCENKQSIVCPSLKSFMKNCYENNKLIVKVKFTFCFEENFGIVYQL